MTVVVVALAVGLLLMARPSDLPPPPRARDAVAASTGSSAALSVSVSVRDATAAPRPIDADTNWADEQRAARSDREQMITSLRQSGSGQEVWVAQGTAALDVLAHASGVQMTEAGCFIAGCGAVFTFATETEYRRGVDTLLASDAFRAWTGGKRFAPPERMPDGRVVIAIVLYRPD
jgi:hypothetical protein